MKIKEVEQKTKLSAKAIRLYEDKGLIQIRRDANDYREYTDEDVEKLLMVKLYRKCGLSLQEVYDVFWDETSVEDLMYEKIVKLDKDILDNEKKKELCLDVVKAKWDYTKLYEYIETLESEEYTQLLEALETPPRSLATQLFQTLMCLGPILWFFIFLNMGKVNQLIPAFIMSMLSTAYMAISWHSFLKEYKFNKETVMQGLGHTLRLLVLCVIFVGIIIFALFGITSLQYCFFLKDDIYMYAQSGTSIFFSIIVLGCIFEIALGFYGQYFDFKAYEGYMEVYQWIKKHIVLSIIVLIASLYCALINVTTVSPQQIVYHSVFNPMGKIYDYEDIEKIECGFLGGTFHLFREKGDFFYEVTMKDGKTLKFNETQTIDAYEEDTYSELVVFDKAIMQYGVEKVSSEEYSEFALLDEIYIERFKSIVNNK